MRARGFTLLELVLVLGTLAGTFVSYPNKSTYALVATGTTDAALDIAALRWGLSRTAGDQPWLDAQSFAFPIEAIALAAASPPDTPPVNPPPCDQNSGKA